MGCHSLHSVQGAEQLMKIIFAYLDELPHQTNFGDAVNISYRLEEVVESQPVASVDGVFLLRAKLQEPHIGNRRDRLYEHHSVRQICERLPVAVFRDYSELWLWQEPLDAKARDHNQFSCDVRRLLCALHGNTPQVKVASKESGVEVEATSVNVSSSGDTDG